MKERARHGGSLLSPILAVWCLALLDTSAHAAEHTAFSLKAAQQRIEQGGTDWRQRQTDVLALVGINQVDGLVHDAKRGDLILVGRHETGRAAITLDDLVVALRAEWRYDEWPLARMDVTPDTGKTQRHSVRFEGGIHETAFGQSLFDASCRLGQIAMGLASPGVDGVRTYWDRTLEAMRRDGAAGGREVGLRLWLYPVNPHVVVREGVCVVRGFKMEVFTEALALIVDGKPVEDLKGFRDVAAEAFGHDLSVGFDDLCRAEASFSRLRSLQELVAVSRAVAELEEKPDLSWWLEKYDLPRIETPKEATAPGRDCQEVRGRLWVSGAVRLTAVPMLLNTGDGKALRDTALAARPSSDALSWGFTTAEWVIPIAAGQVKPEELAPLFQEAMFLQHQERHTEAVALYELILKLDARSDEAWHRKGWALEDMERADEALNCYDQALEIAPRNAEAWWGKASALWRLQRIDEALQCLERALEINPGYARAWYTKGWALGHLGRRDEERMCYDRALNLNPRFAEAWCGKGWVLGELGRTDEAVACFDRALEVNPRSAWAWYAKGWAVGSLGRQEEEVTCYDRVLEIDPRYAQAWCGKGWALMQLQRNDEAVQCVDRALEIAPDNAWAWYAKGWLLGNRKRGGEELKCYERALEIDPRWDKAWCAKGAVLHKLGRGDEALKCYDRALDLNPELAQAWYNKAVAISRRGQNDEAVKCYDRALRIQPDDANAWCSKGALLARLGRPGEALKCYERVLEIDPRHEGAWRQKAVALEKLGRADDALKCYDRALETDPEDGVAWYRKGELLRKLKRMSEALSCYDQALKRNRRDPDVWSGRGWALYGLKRYREAFRSFALAQGLRWGKARQKSEATKGEGR